MNNKSLCFADYFKRRILDCREPICKCVEITETIPSFSVNSMKRILMEPGNKSPAHLLPWSVAVGRPGEENFRLEGGGVFILPDIVLTAFHVTDGTYGYEPLWVSAGDSNINEGRQMKVKDIISSFKLREYDLSLLKLDGEDVLGSDHSYLEIVDHDYLDALISKHADCLVAGWGVQSETSSLVSSDSIDVAMTFSEHVNFEGMYAKALYSVQSGCDKGPCGKDSGTGLFVLDENDNPQLAGIACEITRGAPCHSKENPVLYSNISHIKNEIMWLAKKLSDIELVN